eukprot:403351-Pelagomonas_calceolata.AAC.3
MYGCSGAMVKSTRPGNATVGKSALISMYTSQGQKFPKTYSMTLGVDIVMAQVPIPDTTILVELFLYDTAGFDVSKVSYSNDAGRLEAAAHVRLQCCIRGNA